MTGEPRFAGRSQVEAEEFDQAVAAHDAQLAALGLDIRSSRALRARSLGAPARSLLAVSS
jgi:hypothetical protein